MRVIVTMQRPSHVHFYRHAIEAMEADGHDIHVFARDAEVTIHLLESYGIDHGVLVDAPPSGRSLRKLATMQATYESKLLLRAREIQPDVITAIGGVAASHVAKLVGARSIVFTDTEHATMSNRLVTPFADAIWTPDCFHEDLGQKHVRYPGYHELAYLHPDRFTPDPDALSTADADSERPLVVLRLTDWDALHDIGAAGFDDATDVVERLEGSGAQVRITSEVPLPDELTNRQVSIPPEEIHDLLAHASLYLGEGATMAAESAVLGTPSLYVNTLRMGYTDELEARYELLYNFQGAFRHEHAVRTAETLLDDEGENDWAARRERLLADKTDTTDVILDAIGIGDGSSAESKPTTVTAP